MEAETVKAIKKDDGKYYISINGRDLAVDESGLVHPENCRMVDIRKFDKIPTIDVGGKLIS